VSLFFHQIDFNSSEAPPLPHRHDGGTHKIFGIEEAALTPRLPKTD
jgi:hypothetical protein